MTTEEIGTVLGIILAAGFIIVIIPVLTIWSLNTLFGLGLAYSLKNIVAMIILGMFIRGRSSSNNSNKKEITF